MGVETVNRKIIVLIHNLLSRHKSLRFIAVNLYDIMSFLSCGTMRQKQYIRDDERKVIYVINPKVACSSIKESFISFKPNNENDIHIEMEKRGLIHYGSPPPETKDYYKFSIVRNPFSRLVSCYEYRYHKNIYVNGRIVREYDSYLWGRFREDKGFKDFADKVSKTPDCFSDQTFISQTYILCENDKPVVDFIGKIENMQEDYKIIQAKSGLSEIRHANQSGKKKKNWRDYYDEETVNKIYKRYRNDFEVLGYEKELGELLSYIRDRSNETHK